MPRYASMAARTISGTLVSVLKLAARRRAWILLLLALGALAACANPSAGQETPSQATASAPSSSAFPPSDGSSSTAPADPASFASLLVPAEDVPEMRMVIQSVSQAQEDLDFLKQAIAELGAPCPDTEEKLVIGPGYSSEDGLLFVTSTAEPACAAPDVSLDHQRMLNSQQEFWRQALSKKLAQTGLTVQEFSIQEVDTRLGDDTVTFEVAAVLSGEEGSVSYRELLIVVAAPAAMVGINVVAFSPETEKLQEELLEDLVKGTRDRLSNFSATA